MHDGILGQITSRAGLMRFPRPPRGMTTLSQHKREISPKTQVKVNGGGKRTKKKQAKLIFPRGPLKTAPLSLLANYEQRLRHPELLDGSTPLPQKKRTKENVPGTPEVERVLKRKVLELEASKNAEEKAAQAEHARVQAEVKAAHAEAEYAKQRLAAAEHATELQAAAEDARVKAAAEHARVQAAAEYGKQLLVIQAENHATIVSLLQQKVEDLQSTNEKHTAAISGTVAQLYKEKDKDRVEKDKDRIFQFSSNQQKLAMAMGMSNGKCSKNFTNAHTHTLHTHTHTLHTHTQVELAPLRRRHCLSSRPNSPASRLWHGHWRYRCPRRREPTSPCVLRKALRLTKRSPQIGRTCSPCLARNLIDACGVARYAMQHAACNMAHLYVFIYGSLYMSI